MNCIRIARGWLIASLLLLAGAAQAQVPAYQGKDRTQRLLEGVRFERTSNPCLRAKIRSAYVGPVRALDEHKTWAMPYDTLHGRVTGGQK